MKKRDWSILVYTPVCSGKVRHVAVPRFLVILTGVFLILSMGGLARLTYFVSSYGYAKFGVYQGKNENRTFLKKIKFVDKFTQQEAKKADQIITYENMSRLKYGLRGISDDVRKAGVGGRPDAEEMILASLKDPSVNKADSIKSDLTALLRQVKLQNSTFLEMVDHVKMQQRLFAQRPSIWPVHGRVTSCFGERIHPFTGNSVFHEGIDIANLVWTPVIATADGIVLTSGVEEYYGNIVIIDHRNGYKTFYAHLVRANVVDGQIIKRGDILGYLGTSGRSTGPHLHYEVRKVNSPVNPMEYILPLDMFID